MQPIMPKIRTVNFACLVAFPLMLLTAGPIQAQVAVSSLSKLKDSGYAIMDDINTSLLHHVKTGAAYDRSVVARNRPSPNLPEPQDTFSLLQKASSQNEFERAEVAVTWGNFVARRVQAVQDASGYLIPLQTSWRQYDFASHRFAAEFSMPTRVWGKKATTFHCGGEFQKVKYGFRQACITATNLNAGDPSLKYFTIDDVNLARQVREGFTVQFEVYAMAVPDGRYQILNDQQMLLGSNTVSGIQPVKIVNLALVNRRTGEIYAFAFPEVALTAPEVQAVPASVTTTLVKGNTPRWLKYSESDNGIHYADPDSVKRDGDIVLIREMTDYTKLGEGQAASQIGIFSFNCAKRTARGIGLKTYGDHKGLGEMLREWVAAEDMGTVATGSVLENTLNFACNATPVAR